MKELNKFANANGMTVVLLFDKETRDSHVIVEQTRRQVFSYKSIESARLMFLKLVTANIR